MADSAQSSQEASPKMTEHLEEVRDEVTQFVPEHVRNIDLSQYDLLREVEWLQFEVLEIKFRRAQKRFNRLLCNDWCCVK